MTDAETRPEHLVEAPPGHVFGWAAVSLGLLWLAFPPIGVASLAWLAPVPLLQMVLVPRMPGNRPYLWLYFAGLLYWLGTFYFIPIPHPALWGGWLAVSLYMAIYTPMLIGVSRTLTLTYKVPAILSIPLTWTGIEWIRCHFASGMPMVCLSHSQYRWPQVIQIADLSGAYGLTWLIATVATALAVWVYRLRTVQPGGREHHAWASSVVAIVAMTASLIYGSYRLSDAQVADDAEPESLNVALVQTSEDVVFRPMSLEEAESRMDTLAGLHIEALTGGPRPDVVIWPESALVPLHDYISDLPGGDDVRLAEQSLSRFWDFATTVQGQPLPSIPVIGGIGTSDPERASHFNSAVLIRDGAIVDRYFKQHLVMFGEYVPFADRFEWIQKLSPLRNINAGTEFKTYLIKDFRLAPNVCFETTVPHLIRRQVNSLAAADQEPDVLVNITNDGWFFGTSCLDLHFACNVFRAVEMRKPLVVCANTGFSAIIGPRGVAQPVGPRRKTAVLHGKVLRTNQTSVYRRLGDTLPMLAGIVVLGVLCLSIFKSVVSRRS